MSYEETLDLDDVVIEGTVSPFGYVTLDIYQHSRGNLHLKVTDLDRALSFLSNLREALRRQENP